MANARKISRGETAVCPVQRDADGVWHVKDYDAARAVLRSTDTRQAGLGIESVEKLPAKIRRPVLYRDGPEHREHRKQTARYFTPRRVDEHYRALMHSITAREIASLSRDGQAHLSELSFRVAVDVAKAVIGLTDSKPGTDKRLERFFPEKFGKPGFTSPSGLYWFFRQNFSWLSVYLGDVRPAVRTRRRERRDDLISHLINEGCTNSEILGECLTFAAAGMITTREFINVVAWHLFTDDELRERYTKAEEADRFAILHELLRLEPVVGNLKRRTTADLTIGGVRIPAGELVDIAVSVANVDPSAAGDDPLTVCPARPVNEGLSFGDGPHKCPGAHIAIREADIFLTKLFALEGLRMVSEPRVSIKEEISGYELRGLIVAVG